MKFNVLFSVACMSLALSGCGRGDIRHEDVSIDHPIDVYKTTKFIKVSTDGHGSVAPPQRGWESVSLDFSRRGTGPLIIEGNRNDVRSVSRILVNNGVSAQSLDLRVLRNNTHRKEVRVFYSANEVRVPECKDFSSDRDAIFSDFYHTVTSNFGCSNQRVLGQMISNPGDLSPRFGRLSPTLPDAGKLTGGVLDYGTYEKPANISAGSAGGSTTSNSK